MAMVELNSLISSYRNVIRLEHIEDIKDRVRNGKTFSTTTRTLDLIPEDAHNFCLHTLKNVYGDAIINTAFAGSNSFTPIPIKQHVQHLEKQQKIAPKDMPENDRIILHGVINLIRLLKVRCNLSNFPQFSRALCFIWIGLSRGRMHFDIHNNFLCQISGQKDVVIIPPEYTKQRGGQKYLNDFSIWDDKYKPSKGYNQLKVLENIPHYLVSLKPGECVFIPSGAYHAPFATTVDSVSINAFLVPKTGYIYRKNEMQEKWPLPIVNFIYRLSYFFFRYFGTPLSQGAFEII